MRKEIKLVLVAVLTLAVTALVVLLASGCGTVPADDTEVEPVKTEQLTGEQVRLNLKSFDYVWAKIHESLWEEILVEAGWDEAHLEFRPRIERAETMHEWRQAMTEMLDRLRLSHTQIIPAEAYEKHLADSSGGGDGETGISVRVLGGRAVVTRVREGSDAWKKGVRPGWVLANLGGRNVEKGLAELAEVYEGHHLRDLTLLAVTQFSLSGDTGESVSAVFLDGAEEPVEMELVYEAKRGEPFEFGNLPLMHVWFDAVSIEPGVEYFAFNMFMDPARLVPEFGKAVERAQIPGGLIVDLRGNLGGMGAMASWMSGFLYGEKGHYFGTFKMKGTELKLLITPRQDPYVGPVAVLIDGLSLSAAEFLADGLQKTGRAKVFGQRTTGFALPSVIEKLPNGDAIQYVHADYVNSEGERLEGTGVVPDYEVVPTRGQLLEGKDPVLDAAIEWIRSAAGNE
jgi:carboxyl-terminal processing protease